jgi:diguanylate cyclase
MLGILSKRTKEDVTGRVVARLDELGLPGLPRNYETIYVLETSPTKEMKQAFARISEKGNPTQDAVDEFHRRFIRATEIPLKVHERFLSEVRDVVNMLDEDRTTRLKYSEVLVTAANGITTGLSESVLNKLIGVIRNANEAEEARGKTTSAKIRHKSREIEDVKRDLERFRLMALEDPLTGISNRRVFDSAISKVYDEPGDKSRTALILMDIDHFKRFNDRYGHPIGDQVLRVVADVLRNNVDADSVVCRTGGEEFGIIVRDVTPTQAVMIAERLRLAIGKSKIVSKDDGAEYGSVSMSFGVCMASACDTHGELYATADAALYTSKNDGRDRCTLHVVDHQVKRRRLVG